MRLVYEPLTDIPKKVKKYTVYCHTNKINGKRYVGITGKSPNQRWDNGNGYKNNPMFSRAIKKYGWDNFHHDILFVFNTQQEANLKERELIKNWKLQDSNYGYNICDGGYDSPITDKIKSIISLKAKDRWKNIEYKEKMKKSLSKRWDNPEFRKKMYSCGSVVSFGHKPYNNLEVICLESGIIYNSIEEAGKKTGICSRSIGLACSGRYYTAGGFHWDYVDTKKRQEAEQKRIKMKERVLRGHWKFIKCVETGNVYNYSSDLAKILNVSRRYISYCILKNKPIKGLHYKYIEEAENG